MNLTGTYEHTIDAKNRLAIPSDIRSQWSETECGRVWVALPWPTGGIRLYTEREFNTRADQYRNSLTPSPDQAELQVRLFSMARRLEMDAAGRVRLPEEHLRLTALPREVVLLGAGEWLEVRARDAWRASVDDVFKSLPDLMARAEGAPPPPPALHLRPRQSS
ncbi:MAG: hypothetical protein D6693_00830 [Planctomycetota bacterium]|nr:MAG: hypothetical protein D6693_00830 [Planctomycetota bacterium]